MTELVALLAGGRGARWMPEVVRNAFLTTFVCLLAVYPLLDRQLHLNQMGSMNPILIYTVLALGLNIVVGFAGLLDLGYAAFFAIGGYTAAFLTSPSSPMPIRADFWVGLVASWFVAAGFGLLLGAPTLRLRGDYLAIVTLAFGEIVPRAFLNLEQWTGGSRGMNPIERAYILGCGPGHYPTTLGPVTLGAQVPWTYLIVAV